MKPEHFCANHPTEEAVSVCHHCHDWFCLRCLEEGPEYYFCHKPACLAALETARGLKRGKCSACGWNVLSDMVYCPSCGKQLRELTDREKADDLVTIARYNFSVEAQLARTKLQSEGIEAYIADEHVISIDPLLSNALGGVRLQVRKTESNRASTILNQS